MQQFYPALLLLFVPLLFNLDALFPWARADWNPADVSYQPGYLNEPFLIARTLVYLAVWLGLMLILRKGLSSAQACVGLCLYLLVLSFFAIDWVMALEPGWFSTMFGFIFMVDHLLGGLTTAMLIALVLPRLGGPDLLRGGRIQQDLGNLLLAGVVLWFYVCFMQYLIIRIADLPDETVWYRHRNGGGWEYIVVFFVVLNFVLPTALLFSYAVKRARRALFGVILMVFVARWLYLYWLVMPSFHPNAIHFSLWQLLISCGIGSLWLLYLIRRIPRCLNEAGETEVQPREEALDGRV